MSGGRAIPAVTSHLSDEAISFAIDVIDASGVAERLEAHLVRRTGRRRTLSVRALLVALLLLAIDDRPLHLKAATRLLYCALDAHWRAALGVVGEAGTKKSLLARYRCVRYLFHLATSVMDPSKETKNRVIDQGALDALAKELSQAEVVCEGSASNRLSATSSKPRSRCARKRSWHTSTARSASTPPSSRSIAAARRAVRAPVRVTPTAGGTSAKAITVT